MNGKSLSIMLCFVVVLTIASVTEAHKYYSGQQYQQPQHERCVCDCAVPNRQPVLPNRPYYGSAGYAQPGPRPSGGGYGNSGAYAVSGSYGAGGGQVSGGY